MAAIKVKKYVSLPEEDFPEVGESVYFVGGVADIKAMYKSIARNQNTEISPLFCEAPKFSESRQVYALCIDKDNWMTVVNSDTMLSLILAGDVIPA